MSSNLNFEKPAKNSEVASHRTEVWQRLSGPGRCRPRPPSGSPDPRRCGTSGCPSGASCSCACTGNRSMIVPISGSNFLL